MALPIFCSQELARPNPLSRIVGPVLIQLGFGGFVGYGTGFFFKKFGKIVAVLFASVFICIQILIHFGYIPGVDWARLGKDITSAIDNNILNSLWNLLVHNIPFAASFAFGFLLGLRKG